MKYLIITCLVLGLISCEDIYNSDSFRKIYIETDIGVSKPSQETNVLLPLKVGMKQYYMVEQYMADGGFGPSCIDSLWVKEEIMIDNQKWFRVHTPQFFSSEYFLPQYHFEKDVYLTNTDKGLFLKNDTRDDAICLAHYPDNSYLFRNPDYIYSTESEPFLASDTLVKENCSRFISYSALTEMIDNIKTLKYSHSIKLKSSNYEINPTYVFNFAPDIGLIRLQVHIVDTRKDRNNRLLTPRVNREFYLNY